MNFDLNKLITSERRYKHISVNDLASNKEKRIRSSVARIYDANMQSIRSYMVAFESEMELHGQAPIFSLNKKQIVFANLLKYGNPTYIGYCYLTGYGTKKDILEAECLLSESTLGKELLAKAYIVGIGVSRDFNKAFNVFPDPQNPICNFSIYMQDDFISIRELLFDNEKNVI